MLLVLVAALVGSPGQSGTPADVGAPPPAELCGISDVYLDVSVYVYSRQYAGGRGDAGRASALRAKLKEALAHGGGPAVDRLIAAGVPQLNVSITLAISEAHPGVSALHTSVEFTDVVRLPRMPGVAPTVQGALWQFNSTSLVDEQEVDGAMSTAAISGIEAFLRQRNLAETQGPAAWCKGRITTR